MKTTPKDRAELDQSVLELLRQRPQDLHQLSEVVVFPAGMGTVERDPHKWDQATRKVWQSLKRLLRDRRVRRDAEDVFYPEL